MELLVLFSEVWREGDFACVKEVAIDHLSGMKGNILLFIFILCIFPGYEHGVRSICSLQLLSLTCFRFSKYFEYGCRQKWCDTMRQTRRTACPLFPSRRGLKKGRKTPHLRA
ncbi:unnamed protein product [Ixodes pacificus]